MGFAKWDAETGTMKAGAIRRASSSNDKVWGEQTDVDLEYGVFCAVAEKGVTAIKSVNDVIHGIVVRDIYEKARKDRMANIGHFSHGDSVVAQGVANVTFKRGEKVYVVCTDADAGKVTNKASATTVDLGYWAEAVSGDCVAITLGYQVSALATGETK